MQSDVISFWRNDAQKLLAQFPQDCHVNRNGAIEGLDKSSKDKVAYLFVDSTSCSFSHSN
jgi:hypothetical protein